LLNGETDKKSQFANLNGYRLNVYAVNTIFNLKSVIIAIDNLKILDPAVGSGAYPMGILQRLVFI
jgi:hypothetical protein